MRKPLAAFLALLLAVNAFPVNALAATFEEGAAPRIVPTPATPLVPQNALPDASLGAIPALDVAALTPLPAAQAALAPISSARADVKAAVFQQTAADGQKITVRVIGESSALPSQNLEGHPIVDEKVHDAIVVGGGYSGLSAAWALRDKDVIVLERETHPGGLGAQGESRDKRRYARGAAYITEPTDEVKEIWDSIGMPAAEKLAIKEPIDSVFYKGELIKDVWSEESLTKLPPGFWRFKRDLERMDSEDYFDFDVPEDIPEKAKYLDKMSVEEFLKPYGPELSQFLLDSYNQSALGGHSSQVGALGFLLFYSDEIVTRYTWPGGTGGGTELLARKLWERHSHVFRTRSAVQELKNVTLADGSAGVEATYVRDGEVHVMRARRAVAATPLNVTAKLVAEMPAGQKAKIAGIKYADYIVHDVFVPSGSIWKEGYDTWVSRFAGKIEWTRARSFTDFIDGRWVETAGHARPHEGPGIISIYQPLAAPGLGGYLSPSETAALALKAVLELREFVPALANEKELVIESNRWPGSIHLTEPGYLTETAAAAGARIGNIILANNNLGTPAFETSLVGGSRAGKKIVEELDARRPRLGVWLAPLALPLAVMAPALAYAGAASSRTGLLGALALGFWLGVKHAADPDHVAAVSTFVARAKTFGSSWALGALWGVGHSLTVFGVGAAIIAAKLVIAPHVGLALEFAVGLMLVALGALNIAGRGLGSRESRSLQLGRSLGVGVVHGLAGSAAVALLVLSTIATPAAGLAYLGIFGLGTLAGMLGLSAAMELAMLKAGKLSPRLGRSLALATGFLSLAFGLWVLWQTGVVGGLFSAHPAWTPR